jgi:hypothetical protein
MSARYEVQAIDPSYHRGSVLVKLEERRTPSGTRIGSRRTEIDVYSAEFGAFRDEATVSWASLGSATVEEARAFAEGILRACMLAEGADPERVEAHPAPRLSREERDAVLALCDTADTAFCVEGPDDDLAAALAIAATIV